MSDMVPLAWLAVLAAGVTGSVLFIGRPPRGTVSTALAWLSYSVTATLIGGGVIVFLFAMAFTSNHDTAGLGPLVIALIAAIPAAIAGLMLRARRHRTA
jgi:hypothetical protein